MAEQHAAGNFALIFDWRLPCSRRGDPALPKGRPLARDPDMFRERRWTAAKRSDPLLAPKRLLRSRLRGDDICDLSGRQRIDPRRHVGYRYEVAGRLQYVIHAATFRSWFSAEPAAFEAVLDWLVKKGCLRRGARARLEVGQRPRVGPSASSSGRAASRCGRSSFSTRLELSQPRRKPRPAATSRGLCRLADCAIAWLYPN